MYRSRLDLVAGEFNRQLQFRETGPLWSLFPLKQYNDHGLLSSDQSTSWYLIHLSSTSRDYIDLRVYALWLCGCAVVASYAVMQSEDNVANRLFGLAALTAGVPLAASLVMGMGGLRQAFEILIVGWSLALLAIVVRAFGWWRGRRS